MPLFILVATVSNNSHVLVENRSSESVQFQIINNFM